MRTTLLLLAALALLPFADAVCAERENLALGRLVYCQNGANPEYAVDGRRDGPFHGSKCGADNWFEVDLDEIRTIGTIRLFFWCGDKRYYQYRVTVSADGVNWTEAADALKNTGISSKEGATHRLNGVKARFVRVYIVFNSVNSAGHLREIEVYEQGDKP